MPSLPTLDCLSLSLSLSHLDDVLGCEEDADADLAGHADAVLGVRQLFLLRRACTRHTWDGYKPCGANAIKVTVRQSVES